MVDMAGGREDKTVTADGVMGANMTMPAVDMAGVDVVMAMEEDVAVAIAFHSLPRGGWT